MTEKSIIEELSAWIDDKKFPFQMERAFIYGWECDYWAMTSEGVTREFEIKVDYKDLLNDAKKEKHKKKDQGANFFYYVVPKNLVHKTSIDKDYGLIYIWPTGMVEIAKRPTKLHDKKFEDWKMLANKLYWRYRNLLRQKFIDKEISLEDYRHGFNLNL